MTDAPPLASEQITALIVELRNPWEGLPNGLGLKRGECPQWACDLMQRAADRIAALSASPAPSGQGVAGEADLDVAAKRYIRDWVPDHVKDYIARLAAPARSCAPGEVEPKGYLSRDQFQAFACEMLAQVHAVGGDMLAALTAAAKAGVDTAALSPQGLDAKEGGNKENNDDVGDRDSNRGGVSGGSACASDASVSEQHRGVTPSQRLDAATVEREALERALDRIDWPAIHAFQDELRKGQDIYEDAGGFMARAIKALFGIKPTDPVTNYRDAAAALVEALATEPHGGKGA